MNSQFLPVLRRRIIRAQVLCWIRPGLSLFTLLILFPALALAQSPFDTGFTAMQTLFTGTVAKVASLIAIVVGGYQFAHGEPGAKKTVIPFRISPRETTLKYNCSSSALSSHWQTLCWGWGRVNSEGMLVSRRNLFIAQFHARGPGPAQNPGPAP